MSKIHSPNIEKIKKELVGKVGTYLDQLSAAQSEIADRYRTPNTRHAAIDLIAPPLKDGVTAEDIAALLAKDNARLTAELEKSKAAAVRIPLWPKMCSTLRPLSVSRASRQSLAVICRLRRPRSNSSCWTNRF